MSANIFISFAGHDLKVASTLCKALESRGFKCWISSRDILPGENFQVAIVRAIRNAKMMLLVFTGNSNNSEEMTKELALASQHKLMVVPLRIEDVTPNDAFAYEFATRQWIDFFSDWETAMNQLSDRIASAIPPEASPEPAAVGVAPKPGPAVERTAPAPPAAAPAAPEPALTQPEAPAPAPPLEGAVATLARPPAPAALREPEPKPEPKPATAPPPAAAESAAAKQAARSVAPAAPAAKREIVKPQPPVAKGPQDAAASGPGAKKTPVGLFVAIGAVIVIVGGAALMLPSFLGKKPVHAAAEPAVVPAAIVAPAPQPAASVIPAPAPAPLAATPAAKANPEIAPATAANSLAGDDTASGDNTPPPQPVHHHAQPRAPHHVETDVPF